MSVRPCWIDSAALPANGTPLQLKAGTTGELEGGSGGGSALVRGSGLLQGYTDSGSPATEPPTLIITLGSFNTSFTWSITVSGTLHAVTAATIDPVDGTYFMDTTSLFDVAGLVSAMVSIINSQAWASATDDGTVRVDLPGSTGASVTLSGVTDLLGSVVSGGGSGTDEVLPSGAITEVTLIAQDGAKTVKPVKVMALGAALGAFIEISLKVGGVYYPIVTALSDGHTTGEPDPSLYYDEWVYGRASAALVAQISGTPPSGGSKRILVIAEQY